MAKYNWEEIFERYKTGKYSMKQLADEYGFNHKYGSRKAKERGIKKDEIVLDPFGGSGSTLIAAEQTGRIAYLNELDPKYVDVIVKRFIEFKNNDSEVFLLRDGERFTYRDLIN